jgi:hypothetical protein
MPPVPTLLLNVHSRIQLKDIEEEGRDGAVKRCNSGYIAGVIRD